MKQHITNEQFEELSKRDQKILRDWANQKQYYVFGTGYMWNEATGQNDYVGLPPFLIDIGQMIEFLNMFVDKSGYGEWVKFGIFENNGWVFFRSPHKDCTEIYTGVEIELCDCLWKAIKEVLKDDN